MIFTASLRRHRPHHHLVLVAAAFLVVTSLVVQAASPGAADRSIQIINESGRRVEAYWVHATTDELVKQSDPFIFNGATFALNSYMGHKFQIREMPGQKSGLCGDKDAGADADGGHRCRVSYFTVNSNYEQTVTIKPGLVLDHQDGKSLARADALKTITDCQLDATRAIEEAGGQDVISKALLTTVYDELLACVEQKVAQKIEAAEEEVSFQSKLRSKMGTLIDDYTCNDSMLQSHEAASTHTWHDRRRDISHKVEVHYEDKNIKADTSTSNDKSAVSTSTVIHVIKKFVTAEECEALKWKSAQGKAIEIPWNSAKTNAIARLGHRMLDYGYHVTKAPLRDVNQEYVVMAKYVPGEANDADDNAPLPAPKMEQSLGDLVGTILVHCDMPTVPTVEGEVEVESEDELDEIGEPKKKALKKVITNHGGATIFRNAGVHIIPEVGDAILITYGGDHEDTGSFVEYSQCPLTGEAIGTKTVYRQTLRLPPSAVAM